MPNTFLDAALEYLNKYKFSVIPFKADKSGSYISTWKEYQQRFPTEEEIRKWWTKWPHAFIAIITGKLSGIFVVDKDIYKCKTEDEFKAIEELVPSNTIAPTAISPRNGLHLYFKYPEEGIGSRNGLIPNVDIKGDGGVIIAPPSCNGTPPGYRWQDQASLGHIALGFINNNILINIKHLIRVHGLNNQSDSNKTFQSVSKHNINLDEGNRGETMFHIANCLIKGGMKRENTYEVLRIIAKNCTPPFSEHEIPARINSALGRMSDRNESLTKEVREWVSISEGWFSISNCFKSISNGGYGVSNHNISQIRVILHRLSKGANAILEKDPSRDGIFRRIDNKIEEVDWLNVEDEEFFVKYPFNIQNVFKTMPKNIIVVAGTSNAGKTAFLLDFVQKNIRQHRDKIHYFSSEMGAMELKARIKNFNIDLSFWKHFKFYERAGNFSDVIRPDEINIIDYLDVTDEFYKVGGMIKDIFDKLNKGIAVIALQKNPDKEFGRGGAMSIEKARLYLTIDPGRIKIVKAKNWRDDVNPNGLYKSFSLIKGSEFVKISDWKKEDKDCNQNYTSRQPGMEG